MKSSIYQGWKTSAHLRSLAMCMLLGVLFFTLSFPRLAQASPGDLDSTFGTGGLISTNLSGGEDWAFDIAVQSDGKIVVAGRPSGGCAIVRYNSDGSLDPSFGAGGIVTTGLGGTCWALVIQPDGKMVVAGDSGPSFLARFNPDGNFDSTFGNGGKVEPLIIPYGRDLALQADGKIVVGGYTCCPGDFTMARYDSDGNLDTFFGASGVVTTDFGGTNDFVDTVILQDDGKIVLAGSSDSGFALARYHAVGSLDTTFGNNGLVTTNTGYTESARVNAAIQSDGKIVAAGHGLVRYYSDGNLDPSFGTGGIVVTACNCGDALGLLIDGKIVVAGYTFNFSTLSLDFALARYNSDGSLDSTFGIGGMVSTDFGGGGNDRVTALSIQTDGKMVAAGRGSTLYNEAFAVARYLGDVDTDGDGYPDDFESLSGSDPLNPSSTPEVCDGIDNDLDGQVDEGLPDTDGDGQTDCVDTDDDNDGLPDTWEIQYGLNPMNATGNNGAAGDPDGDGFTNLQEFSGSSDPMNPASVPSITGPSAGIAYVADDINGGVAVVDTATRQVVTTVPLGNTDLCGVTISPDQRYVYVAQYAIGPDYTTGALSIINTSTHTEMDLDNNPSNGTTPLPVNDYPCIISFLPDGSKAYVTGGNGDVMVLNTATFPPSLQTTIPLTLDSAQFIAVTPDGSYAYVTTAGSSGGGSLLKIDTATDQVVASYPISDVPGGVAVSPDGSTVYVGAGGFSGVGGSIFILGPQCQEGCNVPRSEEPYGVTVRPDGHYVYFTTSGSYDPNAGQYINQGILVLDTTIDPSTMDPIVAFVPAGFGYTPRTSSDGAFLYDAEAFNGTLAIVDTALAVSNPAAAVVDRITINSGSLGGLDVTRIGGESPVDTDGDGYTDAFELMSGSDPFNAASTPEVCDGIDNDLDGQIDEGFADTDGDGQADCLDADDDNDGLPDIWEIQYGLNPIDDTGNNGASGDPDGDGSTNLQEYQGGSNPQDPASVPPVNQAWVAEYGSYCCNNISFSSASAIVTDASGNVYVTGDSIHYSAGLNQAAGYATIKYNSNGDPLWVARYENASHASALAVDSSGNVYVTGWSGTLKYDANGNQLWVSSLPGSYIALDGQDNAYTGSWGGGLITVKYDTDGNVLWTANRPGTNTVNGFFVDRDGNSYITGPVLNQFVVAWDYLVVKYDTNGNSLWEAIYDSGQSDIPQALSVDSSGSVYVTGGGGTVKFDANGTQLWVSSLQGSHIALDGQDNVYAGNCCGGPVTVKYDTDGNVLWTANRLGTNWVDGFFVDRDGNSYVTGIGYRSSDDYSTVKYDTNGNPLWEIWYDSGGTEYGTPSVFLSGVTPSGGISVDRFGNVYVTGTSAVYNPQNIRYATVKYTQIGTGVLNTLGGTLIDPSGSGASFSVDPDVLPGDTVILFHVIPDPGLSPPIGFSAFGSAYVDITLIPNPSPLPLPGATITLPLLSSLPEGTVLRLFTYDPVSMALADTGIDGAVNIGGLTATFSGVTGFSIFVALVPVLNHPPVADAGPDQIVEAVSAVGALVTLDGSGSSDPDGDLLSFEWRDDSETVVGSASVVNLTLPLGMHTLTLTVNDGKGGTTSDAVIVTVQDTTPPMISASLSTPSNAAGWHNADVTVTFNCEDAVGIAACSSPVTVSTETAGQVIAGTAVDTAGYSTSTSVTIRLDKTTPTLTFGSMTPVPNAAGWNTSDVTISFTPADNLSGVAGTVPALSPLLFNTDGSGLTQTVTVTDVAGNSAAFTSPAVNRDTTEPIGTIAINGGEAWTDSRSVTLTLSCSDITSGCARMQFSNNGTSWSALESYSINKDWTLSSGNGTKTVYVRYTDVSGNLSESLSDTITFDNIRPAVSNVSDFPDPFRPSLGQVSTISFILQDNLSGSCSVEIRILNSSNALVRTMSQEGLSCSAGGTVSSVIWDGRNGSGVLVPQGNYTYRIRATDQAQNPSTIVSGTTKVR